MDISTTESLISLLYFAIGMGMFVGFILAVLKITIDFFWY